MERWTVEGPQTLTLEEATELKVRLVAGHVDVVATDGPPKIEVHDVVGDPLVVSSHGGRVEVGYEDLGSVFDFEGGSAMDGLQGVGEALRDLLQHGRTRAAQEWANRFPWFGRKRSAVVSIAVPRQCRLRLNVVSASAVVAGLDTETWVKSVSGDVTLDGLAGTVEAHTVSGDLEAQVLAATLSFVTVSGQLTIAEATSERIHGRTVSGDLTADIELAPGGRLDLSSVSGDVTVRLPESVGATVDVSTTSGDTTCGFADLHRDRAPGRRSVRGVLGDGRGEVQVRTVSGDVHLLPRRVTTEQPA